MVIDGDGVPVASHMWPGNTADVTTLDLVAERLQARFGVRRVCLVADAGMISRKQVAAVEARGWKYILGARLRGTREVRETVLRDSGRFVTVEVERQRPDPMELRVKEVKVGGRGKGSRRYVVCHNPEQAAKDAATRAALLASLEEKLRSGAKNLIANKGYRRYLKAGKGRPVRRPREGPGGGALRRHVGAAHQHHAARRRGRPEIQAALDGRADLPHREEPARHAPRLPQDRRHHLRPRVLLVPRPGAARPERADGDRHRA